MSALESPGERIGRSGLDAGGATVAGLQQALSAGRLTSAELTAFYLARIERLNPQLHAVIDVSPVAAAEARASDRARAAGAARGPLDGIPVLIKDNIGTRDRPATAGSPALATAAALDAFCVRMLRRAGAVILGKANLSEWANFRSTSRAAAGARWAARPSIRGAPAGTRQAPARGPRWRWPRPSPHWPWAPRPTARSCRPPPHAGWSGLKPTVGLVSRAGIVPVSTAQDTAGPMARCVADAAALLGAWPVPIPPTRRLRSRPGR